METNLSGKKKNIYIYVHTHIRAYLILLGSQGQDRL